MSMCEGADFGVGGHAPSWGYIEGKKFKEWGNYMGGILGTRQSMRMDI